MNSKSQLISRRDFAKGALALVGTGGFTTGHAFRSKGIRGANEDIRMTILGLRKKGKQHIETFRKMNVVRIAARQEC